MAGPDSLKPGQERGDKGVGKQQDQTPFTGADHPLSGKDARRILNLPTKPTNAIEQAGNFLQDLQKTVDSDGRKIQEIANQVTPTEVVDTVKHVVGDVVRTAQTHGDVAKQIEKNGDQVVAKIVEKKQKIDKILERDKRDSEKENGLIKYGYNTVKGNVKDVAKSLADLDKTGVNAGESVSEAVSKKGDVGKALETGTDRLVEKVLDTKEKIDRLIGRDASKSKSENMSADIAYGVDKSIIKGIVGIAQFVDRADDPQVQFAKIWGGPHSAMGLSMAKNVEEATVAAWHATARMHEHAKRVGWQKASEELGQAGQKWATEAKPHDWSEKATDAGMLFLGGAGLVKDGIQGVRWLKALKTSAQVVGSAEATIGKTAAQIKNVVNINETVTAATKGVHAEPVQQPEAFHTINTGAATESESHILKLPPERQPVPVSGGVEAPAKPQEISGKVQTPVKPKEIVSKPTEAPAASDAVKEVTPVVDDPFRREFTKEEIQRINAESRRQDTAPKVKKASKIADGENAIPIKDNEIKTAKKKYWDEHHETPITKGHPPILDIVMGAPGSGKTDNVIGPLLKGNGSFLVEADDMRPRLPGYSAAEGGLNFSESGNQIVGPMASDLMSKAMNEGENVVWATVGNSPEILERAVAAAEAKGYTVRFHFADISPNEAARRCFERAFGKEGSGQWVDPRYAIQCAEQVPKVFEDLVKSGRFDPSNFFRYDMHVPKGSPLKPIEVLPTKGKGLKGVA